MNYNPGTVSFDPQFSTAVETAKRLAAPRSITIGGAERNFDGSADLAYTLTQIGAASQVNLLHNWYFPNPVNQRGQNSYTNAVNYAYTIDRWWTYKIGSVFALVPGGISVTSPADNPAHASFSQQLEITRAQMAGKTYTVGVIADGQLISATGAVTAGTTDTVFFSSASGAIIIRLRYTVVRGMFVETQIRAGNTVVLQGAKLELGSVSTLANDPPPDYGPELAKCKRYYRKWTASDARTEALKECDLMRVAPALSTITIDGTTYYAATADL